MAEWKRTSTFAGFNLVDSPGFLRHNAGMQVSEPAVFESELRERRDRLDSLRTRMPDSSEITMLLREVDDALQRLGQGTFGLCEDCHDPIERDRLLADPLIRLCLDHLSVKQRRALEEDLETARSVQNALLPAQRHDSGWDIHYVYEPMGVVSGDYVDVVSRRSSLLALVGDVAGKGVAASLLMSHLHAIFRSLAMQADGISQMVERANRLLCESTQQSSYATLVGVQTTPEGEMEVCNAGHCSPLLLTGKGVSMLGSTGLPLGMFCRGSFPSTSLHLEEGDVLLLYSDGLIEGENSHGEQYGVERLQSCVEDARKLPTAEEIVQRCMRSMRNFLGSVPPADDLTVMAIRRAGLGE